jgi:hypothetical protein
MAGNGVRFYLFDADTPARAALSHRKNDCGSPAPCFYWIESLGRYAIAAFGIGRAAPPIVTPIVTRSAVTLSAEQKGEVR